MEQKKEVHFSRELKEIGAKNDGNIIQLDLQSELERVRMEFDLFKSSIVAEHPEFTLDNINLLQDLNKYKLDIDDCHVKINRLEAALSDHKEIVKQAALLKRALVLKTSEVNELREGYDQIVSENMKLQIRIQELETQVTSSEEVKQKELKMNMLVAENENFKQELTKCRDEAAFERDRYEIEVKSLTAQLETLKNERTSLKEELCECRRNNDYLITKIKKFDAEDAPNLESSQEYEQQSNSYDEQEDNSSVSEESQTSSSNVLERLRLTIDKLGKLQMP